LAATLDPQIFIEQPLLLLSYIRWQKNLLTRDIKAPTLSKGASRFGPVIFNYCGVVQDGPDAKAQFIGPT
jgi:hypothetical protein